MINIDLPRLIYQKAWLSARTGPRLQNLQVKVYLPLERGMPWLEVSMQLKSSVDKKEQV